MGFDKTKKGFVVSVSEDGLTSQIRINGEVFTCGVSLGVRLSIGDVVFVKFPEGSDNRKYVDGILTTSDESGEYLAMTPLQILKALKKVDGVGSGLDADLIDGLHANELISSERIMKSINSSPDGFYINPSKIVINGQDLGSAFEDMKVQVNYDVEVVSTNGNIFKNGIIDTVLVGVVRQGGIDITNTIDPNRFLWTRISQDSEGDVAWNVAHFGGKKQIRVTDKDVYRRATFQCEILEK